MALPENPYIHTRLAEKRRGSCVAVALIVSLAVVLIIRRLSGCPGPPQHPGYLLVVAGNASSLPPPFPLATLPRDDDSRLMDLPHFHFVLENSICNATELLFVVLVHSSPTNHGKRMAIRETWGSQMKVLFLLGRSETQEIEAALESENEDFHDLIQGSFVDSYRNMTYKHVMGLKWIVYRCPTARYILKTDDDVFVNPSGFVRHLTSNLSPHGARRLIQCSLIVGARPSRSYRSKWRVSFNEYTESAYPDYCSGFIVLYSPDVVFRLYEQAQSADYFWIDDVFITGMMARRANLSPSSFDHLILKRPREKFAEDLIDESFVFGPVDLSVNNVYQLWDSVRSRTNNHLGSDSDNTLS